MNSNEIKFQVFVDNIPLAGQTHTSVDKINKRMLLYLWEKFSDQVYNILDKGLYKDMPMSETIINKEYDGCSKL